MPGRSGALIVHAQPAPGRGPVGRDHVAVDRILRQHHRLRQLLAVLRILSRTSSPGPNALMARIRVSKSTTGMSLTARISSLAWRSPWAAGELGVTSSTPVGAAEVGADAEQPVLDLLALLQGLDGPPAHPVHGDGVARHGVESRRARGHRRQADQLPPHVHDGPSAHAQVELGVELEQGRDSWGSWIRAGDVASRPARADPPGHVREDAQACRGLAVLGGVEGLPRAIKNAPLRNGRRRPGPSA